MKPIYEAIDVNLNTSLKIAAFRHSEECETIDWHIHPEYELVFIKNGSGVLRIDSREIPYHNGALLFLGPNIPHANFGNKEYADNLEVVIQFGKEFVEEKVAVFAELQNIRVLVKKAQKAILFSDKIKAELSLQFEALDISDNSEKLIQFLKILNILAKEVSEATLLFKKDIATRKTSDVERLETVFEYVNMNYREGISTQGIAESVGLTTNSFCRFFKKMVNKPFIQFVNEFRTRRAAELFSEHAYSVSEVMYKCGYTDASYFTRQFKKNHGLTPTQYLERMVS